MGEGEVSVVCPDAKGRWCYLLRLDNKFLYVAFECPLCGNFNYLNSVEIGEVVECKACGVKLRLNRTFFSTTFDVANCGTCYVCQAGYVGGRKKVNRVDELVKFLLDNVE